MLPLQQLLHLDELDAAIVESSERPVLLFKHSRTCGVSCEALDELHAHVDIPGCRRLTNSSPFRAIVSSPTKRPLVLASFLVVAAAMKLLEPILLRNGRPIWSASQFRITKGKLDDVMQGI